MIYDIKRLAEKTGYGKSTIQKWTKIGKLQYKIMDGKRWIDEEQFRLFLLVNKIKKPVNRRTYAQLGVRPAPTTKVVEDKPIVKANNTNYDLRQIIIENENTHKFTPKEYQTLCDTLKLIERE